MTGLHRYYKIWNNFFKLMHALNYGIGGDKVQQFTTGFSRGYCFMALLRLGIALKNDTITLIFLFAGYSLVMNAPL